MFLYFIFKTEKETSITVFLFWINPLYCNLFKLTMTEKNLECGKNIFVFEIFLVGEFDL